MLQSPQFSKVGISDPKPPNSKLKKIIVAASLAAILIIASVVGKKSISITDVTQLIVNVVNSIDSGN